MPPPPATRSQRCGYCSALLAPGPGGWRPAAADAGEEPLADPHFQRLWVGGKRYAMLGRIARGESCDVFLARRDGRLTERVLIKVLHSHDDADLLDNEQRVLEALEKSSAQGAPYFTGLLPQRIASSSARLGLRGDEGQRRATVMRWRSGFVHTFADVFAAHSSGIAPEAAVWMWKRMLENLGWVHKSGFVHGAILPQHTLVHARDHGIVFVGWSCSVPMGKPLPATNPQFRAHYPDGVWQGAPATARTDIAMSARLLLKALGGAVDRAPSSTPGPLAHLLEGHARGDSRLPDDAWAVRDELDQVARRVFGPPKFIPFAMPGWKSRD